MGDIHSHAAIAEQIMQLLASYRPGQLYRYFELGNWFTDVSQAIDPPSFMRAKLRVWDLAQPEVKKQLSDVPVVGSYLGAWRAIRDALLDLGPDLDDYLDALFGGLNRAGELGKYLKGLMYVDGWETFRHKSNGRPGIAFDHFDYMFNSDEFWTQYYPHEHLDFPAWPPCDLFTERTIPSTRAVHSCSKPPSAGGGRKLYQYQEEQILYVVELLTQIEHYWARTPGEGTTKKERNPNLMLARFGHASHALEDFFFHSNFTEYAWRSLGSPLPTTSQNATRAQRILFRRLRDPLGEDEELDAEKSKPMTRVYTGYFGDKDFCHSLMDTLETLRARSSAATSPLLVNALLSDLDAIRGPNLPPPRNEQERRQRESDRNRRLEHQKQEHKKRLYGNYYESLADYLASEKVIDQRSADKVRDLCKVDRDLWTEYPSVDMGVYGFILQLLNAADLQELDSNAISNTIDQGKTSSGKAIDPIKDERSTNGASKENIGSHSLLAKDSLLKQPLRDQAFNLACSVALYVAKRMVDPAQGTVSTAKSSTSSASGSPGKGLNTIQQNSIDWLHVVEHFLCHPDEAERAGEAHWWKAQMVKPDPDTSGYQPSAAGFVPRSVVDERLKGNMRRELQKRYDDLVEHFEDEWTTRMAGTKGAFGGLPGPLAGAVAGALIGGAIGGPLGAVVGAAIGLIAGTILAPVVAAVGALVGSGLGGLFA